MLRRKKHSSQVTFGCRSRSVRLAMTRAPSKAACGRSKAQTRGVPQFAGLPANVRNYAANGAKSPCTRRRDPASWAVSAGARAGRCGLVRVLVTGVSGYVGAALVPRLRADGHTVRGFARSPERVAAAGVESTTSSWATR